VAVGRYIDAHPFNRTDTLSRGIIAGTRVSGLN
jgi:hypothetical protein